MKIAITRKLPWDVTEELTDFRIEYNNVDEPLPLPRLKQMLGDADGVICTLTDKIDRITLEYSPKLKVIANYGVGYDNIDVDCALEKGVVVCTAKDVLTESAAELGFALLLAAARRIAEGDRYCRSGKFTGASPNLLPGMELRHKTLGIFGMGAIGKAVARIASGFSMNVIYCNRKRDEEGELLLDASYADFEELLRRSDFLVVTAPLTAETKGVFGANEFKKMKDTAVFVNIGRGAVVKEDELAEALKEKVIFAAGLDVYESEPEISQRLRRLDNVTLLPHIGSATRTARIEMARMCADSVKSVLKDGIIPPNALNKDETGNRRAKTARKETGDGTTNGSGDLSPE